MKIVIIDDDPMVLKSIEASLEDYGCSIKSFKEPAKAVKWMDSNSADIIISDICMPEFDGFQVLKHVNRTQPHGDLIFITAHGQMDTAIRALREGASDFFEKPFTATALKAAVERTRRFRAVKQESELLTRQVDILRKELETRDDGEAMLGESEPIRRVARDITDFASTDATVLITGESGTGKELVARAIHKASSRKDEPFLTLNCASIPGDLFESEMFGHKRGAFTGAVENRDGYVSGAEGGTLFMDEIGDLPSASQAKILRLLEQKTYIPVGENRERTADVRIIAATNKDLKDLVTRDEFREDLFYRLNVCSIFAPPLRKRKEDIPLLALYFILRFSSKMGRDIEGIDEGALRILTDYDYPGNIRELQNIIENAVIRCHHTGVLSKEDLPSLPELNVSAKQASSEDWPMETVNFETVERKLYSEALSRSDNNVSAAARILGLSRGRFRRRLAALNMEAGQEDENSRP